MKVLVACEESQRVCTAFRELGHEAYSCDIQECSGGHPEWHILGDVLPLINGSCKFKTCDGQTHRIDGKWDLLIAHPPCTYLSSVTTRHLSLRVTEAEKVVSRFWKLAESAVFFMQFALADCDKICVENPMGFMSKLWRRPDQTIHPYYFAESADDTENYVQKRTCLWLKGLPLLEKTADLPKPEPVYICQGEKCKGKRVNWCEGMRGNGGGQKGRAKARSKTFPGIARAMAEQWGGDRDVR